MTVLLTVDVGNSETKLGWFEQDKLRRHEQFPTGAREPIGAVAEFLGGAGQHAPAAAMCSVVSDVASAWRKALRVACRVEPLVVAGDSEIGIVNRYCAPASLGADRLVGALAARELYGAPVIVVSLGTATVLNAVSAQGEFTGGAIAPGVETSVAALAEKAARLLPVRFEAAPRVIATDTRSAMVAGAFFGAVGQIKELLARMRAEMGQDVGAVLTGGRAELVARELDNVLGVEPALTLIGLRLAWEHVTAGRA